jgi:hypothetical protein
MKNSLLRNFKISRRLVGLMLGLAALLIIVGGTASVAHAAGPSPTIKFESCKNTFFGLTPWYQYMSDEFKPGTCQVKCFNLFNQSINNDCGNSKSDLPRVLLAVIDDLLRIAALVALTFVMVSALRFATSQGEPDKSTQAQDALVNALIGLAVAVVAIGFVSFVGNKLGGVAP